ncbi:MAG: DUF4189 domain-containing protein [Formosimonas sp.]
MLKKLVCALALCLSTGSVFAQVCGDGGQFVWDPSGQNSCYGGSQGNRPYGTNVYDGVGPPVNNGGTGSGTSGGGNGGYSAPRVINRYGAVAWNDRTGDFDSSYGQASKQRARQQALEKCGFGCKVVNTYFNQCAAIALGTQNNGRVGYRTGGYHENHEIAEQKALSACSTKANNCKIVLSECSKFDDSSSKM